MFAPGPFELLIVAAILLMFVGIPVAVVVLVVYLVQQSDRGSSGHHASARPGPHEREDKSESGPAGGKMKLECAQAIASADATEADIRNAFADDGGRGEFIILAAADQVFLQASGEEDGPYTLEYREGSADRHFQCTRDLAKAEVEGAFLKYLNRDASWKTDFPWQPLRTNRW
ncbi:MAG: hypothetical protein RBS80_05015 [Thermoguttaceae bacterium]|jgi:hypothetical protein|nr:hypothetical protein [Thermoguttaceae bacterium]